MSTRRQKRMHRRAALQSLAVGLGALGVGRGLFACNETVDAPPRKTTTTPPRTTPTDDDEFVPGGGEPVDAEVPKVPNEAWEKRVKQLESEQARLFRPAVFTEENAGVMDGKQRSHVPIVEIVFKDGGQRRLRVRVQHVMGANQLDAGTYDAAAPDAAPEGGDASSLDAASDGDASDADAGPPPPAHYITTIFIKADVNGVETVIGLYEFVETDPAPPIVDFPLVHGVTSVTAFEWCTLHGLWAAKPLGV